MYMYICKHITIGTPTAFVFVEFKLGRHGFQKVHCVVTVGEWNVTFGVDRLIFYFSHRRQTADRLVLVLRL